MHDSHEEGYRYVQPQACIDELREALKGLLDEHVKLVSSGDCGNWDVETEYPVKCARTTLERTKP